MKIKMLESLEGLMAGAPQLINKYQARDSDFREDVKAWLKEGETILGRFKKPELSEFAALRGQIIAAERGVIERNLEFQSRASHRLKADGIAVFAFNQAQKAATNILVMTGNVLEEVRSLIKHVLGLADQQGILATFMELPEEIRESEVALWQHLRTDNQTKAGLNNVLTKVSFPEALILLKTEFNNWPNDVHNGSG